CGENAAMTWPSLGIISGNLSAVSWAYGTFSQAVARPGNGAKCAAGALRKAARTLLAAAFWAARGPQSEELGASGAAHNEKPRAEPGAFGFAGRCRSVARDERATKAPVEAKGHEVDVGTRGAWKARTTVHIDVVRMSSDKEVVIFNLYRPAR